MKTTKSWLALALVMPASLAFADSKVLLETPVVYAADAAVAAPVREQCKVESLLERDVGKALGGTVAAGAEAEGARSMRLKITFVLGVGGGAFSGPKGVTIDADLVESGKVLRSTHLTRTTTGGPGAMFKGTCAILERSTEALAKDLARWAKEPASIPPSDTQKQVATAAVAPASGASAVIAQ